MQNSPTLTLPPLNLPSSADVMGLGPMLPGPNVAEAPENYGATPMTMMRASGGLTPGLPRIMTAKTPAKPGDTDVMILNAALLLEYLESEYYARIVAADRLRPYLTGRVKMASLGLARDESTHVDAVSQLIVKLGGSPIPKPDFQFPANVFVSPVGFMQQSVELEENGVGAYLGAAPMLKNKEVLNFAASIYGNECRHTGLIRFLLGDQISSHEIEVPRSIAQALQAASPFIVGGTPLNLIPA